MLVYELAITTMVWRAWARFDQQSTPSALAAFRGALLFILSDTALALNRFVREFREAPALVLGSYYLAQLLIVLSVHLSSKAPFRS